jgi:hypothetical protein
MLARAVRVFQRTLLPQEQTACHPRASPTILAILFLPAPRAIGTLAPSRRASESPIAIACFRLVTFLPERPDLSAAS